MKFKIHQELDVESERAFLTLFYWVRKDLYEEKTKSVVYCDKGVTKFVNKHFDILGCI